MARRGLWWGGTAALATAALLVALIPGWRLARERAAARDEGLLLKVPARKADPNLARLLQAWAPAQNAMMAPILSTGIVRILEGREKPGDRRRVVAWRGMDEPTLAAWRAQSQKPTLGLPKDAVRFDPFGSGEIEAVRTAGQALLVAAALGSSPRENLLAAARLSARLRAEPGFALAQKGTALGEECLEVARRLGLSHEADAALGPPTDFRRVLSLGLPGALNQAERRDPPLGLRDWIEDLNPFAPDPSLLAISRWRRLWRELPHDPEDYNGAARVVEAQMPEIDGIGRSLVNPRSSVEALFVAHLEAEGLRAIARFEAARKALR